MTSTPSSNSVIDAYIKRVTELSQSSQRLPTSDELEKIATELGVSNHEIQLAQKECLDNFIRGQSYLGLKHWDDAIEQFQEAIVFNPTNLETLHHLALAYLGRWREKRNREDEQQIRLRIKQALQIQPDHPESLSLLALLKQEIKNRKNLKLALGIGLLAFVSGATGFLFLSDFLDNLSQQRQAKLEQLEGRLSSQIEILRQEQEQLKMEIIRLRTTPEISDLQAQVNQMQQRIAELEATISDLRKPPFLPFNFNP